jgi:hypothetical protein
MSGLQVTVFIKRLMALLSFISSASAPVFVSRIVLWFCVIPREEHIVPGWRYLLGYNRLSHLIFHTLFPDHRRCYNLSITEFMTNCPLQNSLSANSAVTKLGLI